MGDLRWTKTRRSMLELVAKDPGGYSSGYPPLKWLVANGFVEREPGRPSYAVTEAGRAALRGEVGHE